MSIADKTVLVTGATDGVGRLVALELARAGARVLLHGRSAEKAPPCSPRSTPQPAATGSNFYAPISPRSPRCASSPRRCGARPIGSTY